MMRRYAIAVGAAALAACAGETAGPGAPPTDVRLVASVPIPAFYGIHDMVVRDGLAFVCAWDSGMILFDVGHGIRGGSPSQPVRVSQVVTPGGQVHNAWWFHNPNGEKRYLFIGEEGPGKIGESSSGDIHVVDVADLTQPQVVGSFHLAGAGTHNFWMDESAQILYAAYYNGGVVALDVSGALPGDLSSRLIDSIRPGGTDSTFVWGVQLYDGFLYAIDMLTGLWRLNTVGGSLSPAGGGRNVPERFSSDLWVANGYAYTGTWGYRGLRSGNAVKVWRLRQTGGPLLVDSVITTGITTVSDVEVNADGKLLMFSAEGGPGAGFYFYSLADPAKPTFAGNYGVADNTQGIHTATFATINGRTYAFGARDPSAPALLILDVTSLIP
ncbi:MAG: LVIVD repeat-containing protein [Gemmatimonadales bacterium]